MQLRLLSVNIGKPKIIAVENGEPVYSAISKSPVGDRDVFVRTLGIEGDGQADLTVHGGPDKAVYAYPAGNWSWWEREYRLACGPNTFGENLTLEGADETQICIGDRFQWGDAVLEVCQPRGPCFKLGIHTGLPDVPGIMTRSGRAGWYMRVLQEGIARPGATFTRVLTSGGPSVLDAFAARHHPGTPQETIKSVFEAPALAENWRRGLARLLA